MRLEEMQAGTQIPNSYHSMQIDRTERAQSPEEKPRTNQLPPGTMSTIQQVDGEEDRMNAVKRPVTAVQNETMQARERPDENAPGVIVDIQA